MKKYLLLFVILIISFSNNSIFAQIDWDEYFPRYCNANIHGHSDNWTGPYEYNLCMNTIQDFSNFCFDSSCCFKIIYHETTHRHPGDTTQHCFGIYISAVLITNGTNCNLCDKTKIVELFYRELVKCKMDSNCNLYDPDFLNLDTLIGTGDFWTFLLTPGNCILQENPIDTCKNICCIQYCTVRTDHNQQYEDFFMDSGPRPNPLNACDSTPQIICNPYCNEYPYLEWNDSCCKDISITASIVDSTCCIRLNVYNPYCYAPTPRILFQQKNTSTGQYVTEDSAICEKGQTVSYVMCPTNGNKFFDSRILIEDKDNPGHPNCGSEYAEGYTQHTATFDLSSCCSCDPEWLTVNVIKDSTCADSNGCRVTFELNIPSTTTCYNYFVVEDNNGVKDLPPWSLDSISYYNFCLDYLEFGYIKLYLLRDENETIDSSTCFIEKGVECDTASCSCDSLNSANWLDVTVVKDQSCPDSNGCKILMHLNIPDSISCYHYYIYEDVNHFQRNYDTIVEPITDIEDCIGAGVSDTIKVHLFRYNGQSMDSACTITKYISCDSTQDTSSSDRPCDDCPEDEWLPSGTTASFVFNIGNCRITVNYKWRYACDSTYQDLRIVYLLVDSCNIYPRELFQEAIKTLIESDPMGFNPTPSDTGCYDNWRVTIAHCWKFVHYEILPEWNPYELEPCGFGCCMQQLRVCRDSLGVVDSIIPIGDLLVSGNNSTCAYLPEETFPVDTSICYIFCDYLRFDWDIPIINTDSIPNNANIKFTKNENINEYYFEGDLKLTVKTNVCDIIRFEVTNVYGTILKISEIKAKNGDVLFMLDKKAYEKGFYLYKVYCNDKQIGTGKFFVE